MARPESEEDLQTLLDKHGLGTFMVALKSCGVFCLRDLAALDADLAQALPVRRADVPLLCDLVTALREHYPALVLDKIPDETVEDFLERAGCKRYRHVLRAKGVTTVARLLALTERQLLAYGILPVHARMLTSRLD